MQPTVWIIVAKLVVTGWGDHDLTVIPPIDLAGYVWRSEKICKDHLAEYDFKREIRATCVPLTVGTQFD